MLNFFFIFRFKKSPQNLSHRLQRADVKAGSRHIKSDGVYICLSRDYGSVRIVRLTIYKLFLACGKSPHTNTRMCEWLAEASEENERRERKKTQAVIRTGKRVCMIYIFMFLRTFILTEEKYCATS